MSKRNHYTEARLPEHLRRTYLKEIKYDKPVYIEGQNGSLEPFLNGVYVGENNPKKTDRGDLYVHGMLELEPEDFKPACPLGRVGLMKVFVIEGPEIKDAYIADLRFSDSVVPVVDMSMPDDPEYQPGWLYVMDEVEEIRAFVASDKNGREAYYGPLGYRKDLKKLRKYGDKLMRRYEKSMEEPLVDNYDQTEYDGTRNKTNDTVTLNKPE